MKNIDKKLLRTYMIGFEDELSSANKKIMKNYLQQKAYNLGRLDALVGDDINSLDYKTDLEILEKIYND